VNSELCREAMTKVGNPNILINLVSRRVRQLNAGGGGSSRPLIDDAVNLSATDIAFHEIIQDKLGWEMPEGLPVQEGGPKRKKKKKR